MNKITGKGFKHLHIGPVRIKLRHDPLSSRMGWPLIKCGPLDLFSGTNVKRAVVLGSWHHPASITWRWVLWAALPSEGWWQRPYFQSSRHGGGMRQWSASIGFVRFDFSQQRSMFREGKAA